MLLEGNNTREERYFVRVQSRKSVTTMETWLMALILTVRYIATRIWFPDSKLITRRLGITWSVFSKYRKSD